MYGKKSRGSKILATRGRGDFVKFYLAPPKWLLPLKCPPPPNSETWRRHCITAIYISHIKPIRTVCYQNHCASKLLVNIFQTHHGKSKQTLYKSQNNHLSWSNKNPKIIRETNINLASLLQPETYQAFSQLLNTRALSVRNNINERHAKKLNNLANEYRNSNNMDKTKWVVNISSRLFTKTDVEILQKDPKFAPAPSKVPYKEIVANIEAGIENLTDDTKELVRNAIASILDKAQLPANKDFYPT